MTHLARLMQRVLQRPTPADLLEFQGALLALEPEGGTAGQENRAAQTLAVLDDFYAYLVELEGKLEAHAFAELASKLDISAVGGVVLENLAETRAKLLQRILIGALSEALMVLASRQYIKAYNRELDALHRLAAWRVRAHLWRFSREKRPELMPAEPSSWIDFSFLFSARIRRPKPNRFCSASFTKS